MNKSELTAAVSDRTDMSKTDAAKAVDAFVDTVTHALSRGDEVKIPGFGNFSIAERKGGMGRNPRTGEPMMIKASKSPKFKAGKGLKDAVNR